MAPSRPPLSPPTAASSARARAAPTGLWWAGAAIPQRETVEATSLMRELTARDRPHQRSDRGRRVSRVSLFAPLRRLRRSLFGGHRH
ncbi:hypothetical protein [Streptomyces galbus]|uniref:Uncharacterized protein n=1 Tax=Streptomyces galbus TaxID=33898 RepID=A0ABX1IUG4_STRGB|nr:hypothetical protein [Streptomyces galbus]NKQ27863.1 hypothetical protein [Streptomyces galbus]